MYITSDSRFGPRGEFYDNDVNDPRYAGDGMYGTGLDYESSSNPMYDAYYKANPWVGQTYHKTLVDKLFGGIFRTGYDKWRDEMAANAAQYNAGVVDMQQQNQYNSEEAKAMRMRAAGENPDLLGTGDVSEAANTNPDAQDPQIPEADDVAGAFGAITNFVGGFTDIISGAVGMMKTFQDINVDKIRADREIAGLAQEDLFREIPANGFSTQEEFDNWFNHQGSYFEDPVFADFYRKEHNIPRSYWDRYKRAYMQSRNNLPTDLKFYQSAVERAELRKRFGMVTGSEFYNDSGFDELDKILRPLIELQDKATKLEAEIAVLKGQNDKRMQGAIVPEMLGNQDIALDVERKKLANESIQADISGDYLEGLQSAGYGVEMSVADIAQLRIGKMIAECQEQIIKGLRESSDEGSRLAKCLEYQMVISKFYNFNPVNILSGVAGGVSDQITSSRQTAAMLAKMFL